MSASTTRPLRITWAFCSLACFLLQNASSGFIVWKSELELLMRTPSIERSAESTFPAWFVSHLLFQKSMLPTRGGSVHSQPELAAHHKSQRYLAFAWSAVGAVACLSSTRGHIFLQMAWYLLQKEHCSPESLTFVYFQGVASPKANSFLEGDSQLKTHHMVLSVLKTT